ncbi:hypothetical protein HLB35_00230 [Halomonas sp. TBZ9]|uniref:Uncharacterized protein n=1 Tax=Vreelandella azerica TaxID=2732867 RepID=A0A7Y3TUP4_9GAMM|nr:hypothetical protein [Halomonas azerica]NOG30587.1 hypothetical protein [Halomonas azerica]
MTLLDYEHRFAALRLHAAKGNRSPHKVAMLLAVIDLIAQGELSENRLKFDNTLKQHYQAHFASLASTNSKLNPHHPFFICAVRGSGITSCCQAKEKATTG